MPGYKVQSGAKANWGERFDSDIKTQHISDKYNPGTVSEAAVVTSVGRDEFPVVLVLIQNLLLIIQKHPARSYTRLTNLSGDGSGVIQLFPVKP